MKKIFYFLLIIFILEGCTKYFTPEKYANPKRKYGVQGRKVY